MLQSNYCHLHWPLTAKDNTFALPSLSPREGAYRYNNFLQVHRALLNSLRSIFSYVQRRSKPAHFKYFSSETENKLGMAYAAQELVHPDWVTALVLFLKSWKGSHTEQNYVRNENSAFDLPQREAVPRRPGPAWTFLRGMLRGLTLTKCFLSYAQKSRAYLLTGA